jgi:hypothetical protein
MMALGAVAIALSSATEQEHSSWRDAANREGQRYGIEAEYVQAGMEGRAFGASHSRTPLDWLLILGTTALFFVLASVARLPMIEISTHRAVALVVAMLVMLGIGGVALWRVTRFR